MKSTVVDESLSSFKPMYCSREYHASTRLSQEYEKSTSKNKYIWIFEIGFHTDSFFMRNAVYPYTSHIFTSSQGQTTSSFLMVQFQKTKNWQLTCSPILDDPSLIKTWYDGSFKNSFDCFGEVASSVHVIGLWHHQHPASSSLSVYSGSGYIINGSNLIL